jgi:glycosyltransferase involved in cell wall biosynthesis
MSHSLSVLHVIANLGSGGVQHLLAKSLDMFDRKQFRHLVCCVSKGGVYEKDLQQSNIPYWILKRRTRLDPTVIGQMAQLIRREQIDVIHTLNFTANAWGRVAAVLTGVPRIIAHERGTAWTENSIMRMVDRWLYGFTDVWLANSKASKVILMQRIGLPEKRIRVLYNGLPPVISHSIPEVHLRDRLGISPSVHLVGSIGRLDTPKGFGFLLEAIPLVWRKLPETNFVLIGDGPLGKYLRQRAQKNGLLENNRLHFTGFLAQASKYMLEMDIVVQPSIRESLGNVLIEAGWARRPVIGTLVDGCGEVVENGTTGILIPGTEPVEYIRAPGASPLPKVVVDSGTMSLRHPLGPAPQALADAIVTLLSDPTLRLAMGYAARERIQNMFTLERYVHELEALYRNDSFD